MSIALRKRSVEPERVERAITGIIRRIESSGQTEVTSDQVAYIRYASVYRNFREAQDFENFVENLNTDIDDGTEVE